MSKNTIVSHNVLPYNLAIVNTAKGIQKNVEVVKDILERFGLGSVLYSLYRGFPLAYLDFPFSYRADLGRPHHLFLVLKFFKEFFHITTIKSH